MYRALLITAALIMTPLAAVAQDNIRFGNDRSDYSNDGECDDPRFRGIGMASSLDDDDIGRDATDCRQGYQLGRIKLWVESEARAATQCSAIKFGNDTSEWAKDGECDDFRFMGKGADSIQLAEDIGKDATDCKAACELGTVLLRDY